MYLEVGLYYSLLGPVTVLDNHEIHINETISKFDNIRTKGEQIKTGDIVKVIAGNQKGAQGKVLKVVAVKNKAIVEGVNVVKKHNKPSANNPQGGVTEKELFIDISNISLITSKGDVTRVGYRMEKENKVRYSKKSNEVI